MNKKIREVYRDWSRNYDQSAKKNPAVAAVGNWLIKPIQKRKKVLDYGCGTGRAIPYLIKKDCEIVGVDLSREMLNIAKKRYSKKVKFILLNGQKFPFKKNSFDIIHASLLVNHIKDLKKFFKECSKVLKKEGLLLFDCSVKEIMNIEAPFIPKYLENKKESKRIKENYKNTTFSHKFEDIVKTSKKNGFNLEFYKTIIIDSKVKKALTKESYKKNKGKNFWSIFWMRKVK